MRFLLFLSFSSYQVFSDLAPPFFGFFGSRMFSCVCSALFLFFSATRRAAPADQLCGLRAARLAPGWGAGLRTARLLGAPWFSPRYLLD